MDIKVEYEKVREYARTIVMFSVAMVMHELNIGYDKARAAIKKLVEDKCAEYREGVMFEYIGSDKKTVNAISASDYVKALEGKGDTLDPLFCDALIKCAKSGKASDSIVQCELNIHFPRAKKIAETMLELGFCSHAENSPMPMRISGFEAEDIVNMYRLSHIVVATPDNKTEGLSLWDEKALDAAILVELGRISRRISDNTPSEWKEQAQLLLVLATAAGDKKYIELAEAVVGYIEKNSSNAEGQSKLNMEWRRQRLLEKMSYEIAGVYGDYQPVKAEVQKKIVRLFVENPKMSDVEIVELAKKTAAASDEAKSDGFIEDKLVANQLASTSALEFLLFRKRAEIEGATQKATVIKPNTRHEYNVDIALVVDAMNSMGPFIETLKQSAAELFCNKLREGFDLLDKPVNKVRIRLIDYADYSAVSDEAVHKTEFFTLPDDNQKFADAVNGIAYDNHRVDGLAENGLEALYEAIMSDWAQPDSYNEKTRQIIVVLSDAFPLALQERAECPGYCAKRYPPHLEEMSEIWEQSNSRFDFCKLTKGKRLLLFVPEGADPIGHTWSELFGWSGAVVSYVDLLQGMEEITPEAIIEEILRISIR